MSLRDDIAGIIHETHCKRRVGPLYLELSEHQTYDYATADRVLLKIANVTIADIAEARVESAEEGL